MSLVVTWCKCESMDKLVKWEAFIDYIRIKSDKFYNDNLDLNIGSFGFQIITTLWIFLHRWTEGHFSCICSIILSLQQCCSETGKKLLIIIIIVSTNQ